jgi:hypothetical protein
MNEYLKNQNMIQLACHKGDKGGFPDRLVSNIIKVATYEKECRKIFGTQFSHTELIYPAWVREGSPYEGQNCFSSRGMDDPRGVHFKQINFSHSDRWVILPVLWLNVDQIKESFALAESFVGLDYDYLGVVRHFGFNRKDEDDPKKMWCSEADSKALNVSNTVQLNSLNSPNELALQVYKYNYQFKA